MSKNNIKLSHLQFANDLLILLRASKSNADNCKKILDTLTHGVDKKLIMTNPVYFSPRMLEGEPKEC